MPAFFSNPITALHHPAKAAWPKQSGSGPAGEPGGVDFPCENRGGDRERAMTQRREREMSRVRYTVLLLEPRTEDRQEALTRLRQLGSGSPFS